MKRDMDLIRHLLLRLEQHERGFAPVDMAIDGYSDEQVGYHVLVMIEGGLLVGDEVTTIGMRTPRGLASRLTWAGHEFIDAARHPVIWQRTKQQIETLVGSAPFSVWLNALIHFDPSIRFPDFPSLNAP